MIHMEGRLMHSLSFSLSFLLIYYFIFNFLPFSSLVWQRMVLLFQWVVLLPVSGGSTVLMEEDILAMVLAGVAVLP